MIRPYLVLSLVFLGMFAVRQAHGQGNLGYRTGAQLEIDHFKSDNTGGSLGTNVGVGLRWFNAVTDNLHGYATVSTFLAHSAQGDLFSRLYGEAEVNLTISPKGVKGAVLPYFGGGGALLFAAGVQNSGSPAIVAGLLFNHKRTTFTELQYFTHGGRITATVGLFF